MIAINNAEYALRTYDLGNLIFVVLAIKILLIGGKVWLNSLCHVGAILFPHIRVALKERFHLFALVLCHHVV